VIKKLILEELYEQINLNMISHIRKGQVERWDAFVTKLLADTESQKAAERMIAKGESNEKTS